MDPFLHELCKYLVVTEINSCFEYIEYLNLQQTVVIASEID